ncbi:hypothetical protein Bca4012_011985 [Brassica carinata]
MKIFVRTLNGDRFEIQVNPEDMVSDVKKNVETVLGVHAAEQVLIHKGKVLKDETTVEANNVSEKSVIAVMKRKPASTGTSTSSASLKSQDARITRLIPLTPTEPAWDDDGLDLNYERISESNIQQILEMISQSQHRGAWSRKLVIGALRLAYNDVDKALEYLYFVSSSSEPCAQIIFVDFFSGNEMEQPHHELQADQTNEPNNGGGDGGKVAESEETEVEQPQAYQTNKPNNGGGHGCNQVGESEENQVEQLPRELQADQTNKPDYNGGDGGNQVGESDEETEVETTKDAQAKTRVDEAEIEDLRNKITYQFIRFSFSSFLVVTLLQSYLTDGDSSKQNLAGFLELESFLSPVKERMKILVKTLKGARFEIQVEPEDSVADVKKKIETVLGVTAAYPAAEQVLIHKGKVLKDETTVGANNVSEKSIIAVMKRKPASTGTSANLTAQVHAHVPPSSTATVAPRLSMPVSVTLTEPAWDAASNGNYESVSESNIQQILEMVRGAWSRDVVAYALCLAYNDVDKALEYLYFGIPVQSEDPYTWDHNTQEPVVHEEADLERSLDSLRHNPEFEFLRSLVQLDPGFLEYFQEMLEEQNPPLFQLIQDNKADFLRLVMEQPQEPNNGGISGNQVGESEEAEKQPQADQTNKPNNGGGDDSGNQVGDSEETKVEVPTPEDYELIERLEALGFERGDAAVAYFACNRNVQVAANHLLGYKHESHRE